MISRFKTPQDRMKTSLESAPAPEYLVKNVTRREPDPLCVQCEEKGCQEGRLVTDYKQSYIGLRVRLVGRNWTEDMKNKVGVVEGFQDHYLRLRWLVAGKLGRKEKKFKLSRVENKVERFQFQFCCQKDPRHVLFSECCAGKERYPAVMLRQQSYAIKNQRGASTFWMQRAGSLWHKIAGVVTHQNCPFPLKWRTLIIPN